MKQKGFAGILVLILIVAAVGVGAFYLGKSQKRPSQLTPTPQTSPPAQEDETANWKTYTHSSGAFSFKYPPDLFPIERPAKKSQLHLILYSNKEEALKDEGELLVFNIGYSTSNLADYASVKDFEEKEVNLLNPTIFTDREGIKWTIGESVEIAGALDFTGYTVRGNKIISFSIQTGFQGFWQYISGKGEIDTERISSITDPLSLQILSTFKFTQ